MLWKLVIIHVKTGNANWKQLIANKYIYFSYFFVIPLSTWRDWCVVYRLENNFRYHSNSYAKETCLRKFQGHIMSLSSETKLSF